MTSNNGKIILGALPGFPMNTEDPEIVERAIAVIETKASDPTITAMKELDFRQRIRDLRGSLAALGVGSDDTNRKFFIEHAAAFAERKGISYATFREMGVPAAVLKEAGITR